MYCLILQSAAWYKNNFCPKEFCSNEKSDFTFVWGTFAKESKNGSPEGQKEGHHRLFLFFSAGR